MSSMRDYLKKEKVLDETLKIEEIHKKDKIKAKDYLRCLGFNAKRSVKMIKAGKLYDGQRKVTSLEDEVRSNKIKIKIF